MKIAYFLDSNNIYLYLPYLEIIRKYLAKEGIESIVFSPLKINSESSYIISLKDSIKISSNIILKIKNITSKENIDIIHSFSFGGMGILAKHVSNQLKLKIIYTFLRDPYYKNKILDFVIEKYIKFILDKSYLATPIYIPDFNSDFILPFGIEEGKQTLDKNTVGAIDHLTPKSNIEMLLDVAATLSNLNPEYKIIISGWGDIKKYENYIKAKKISNVSITKLKFFNPSIAFYASEDYWMPIHIIDNIKNGSIPLIYANAVYSRIFPKEYLFYNKSEIAHKIVEMEYKDSLNSIVEQYNIKNVIKNYVNTYTNI